MKQAAAILFISLAPAWAETVSPLFARGYVVMPQPQVVRLGASDFTFSGEWKIERQGVAANDAAVEILDEDLANMFHVKQTPSNRGGTLRLVIAPNSAKVGEAQDRDRDVLAQQAYKIDLTRDRITIAANAPAGLYYGVTTFLQLLKPRDAMLFLPEGQIEDWPDLQLRQLYWDDAHHLDRMETLKQAIRQAAFFKMNGFALKLEGHFQFRSAPALVEPQALSPAQFQELTDYGLKHHVQLIPYLDAPGHIAFILKHPEYAPLREYPESNYELCATNPDSYKLLFGMFQDLIDANKGVKYFYLSTDEPYYVGLADNAQCGEAARAKELGSVGKLLAEFITKTAGYLHDRGRTVVFWGESPLKPDDIAALPPHIVNGETYGPQFDPEFRRRGIRQMIYSSTEGEEKLFPDYFPLPDSRRLHPGRSPRRVFETFRQISFNPARKQTDLIGSINAGWADMGLHPETFWLGYATAAAAAWHPGSPDPAESMASFYPLFYGHRVTQMDRVYQLMSGQAQFWSDSWETAPSTARKPIWGNSFGVFDKPRPARDQTLPLPPVPAADLKYSSDWAAQNGKRLQLASEFLAENDELLGLLHENLTRADLNRYNLEVFLSIARLCRHNLEMLAAIGRIEGSLRTASEAATRNQAKQAVAALDQALQQADAIADSRKRVLADAIETWQKSWLPRVPEANGRRFLHEVDDVKDHLPDRTVDMSYLVYRELLLPLVDWVEQVRAARNQYASRAAELRILPEYLRTGPDGEVVAADRPAAGHTRAKTYTGARAGYVSLQAIAIAGAPGDYSLEVIAPTGLQVDVFREWYHALERDKSYVPDALIPVRMPYRSRLPEPDNRIAGQKAQAFWLDVWIPGDARPGDYSLDLRLTSSDGGARVTVPLRVLAISIPEEDVVTIDHNSYGTSWMGDLYPKARAAAGQEFYRSDGLFKLIHEHHRLFYEHRGVFHQLGYGHAGKVGPEFAPVLEGSGRGKHIVSWDLFDRHYGPLFDGSAFAGSRRGKKPIPFAYLPINPEWPASYLWWGEPGYEAEFVNVVSAMERHFREKNWTHTRLELFFNQKKRYMGFPWDGDEERFPNDLPYYHEYGRLLRKAVPTDSPVPFVFRADVSWDMERQAKELAGIVKMWICGDGILSWYPETAHLMKERGDIVWFYSGPPVVTKPAAKITEFPLQAWLWGVDGYVHWQTVSAGADPWFRFDGGGTALVYSGDRFGIEEPIPSIRLKIQRNALQDLALLDGFKERRPLAELRDEAARRFNGSRARDWWNPRPAFADRAPYEWTNTQIGEATAGTQGMLAKTAADAWQNVHEFAMQMAGEAK